MKINLNQGCYIINQSSKCDGATAEHLQSLTGTSKLIVREKMTLKERAALSTAKSSFKRDNPNYKHKVIMTFKPL
jgi:hypothetical protein